MNQYYYMPTRVVMGDGCIGNNSKLFASLGKKALIVTGRHSAKINGSQDDLIKALDAEKIDYLVFDKIKSNPTIAIIYEGAAVAKENKIDFIIAIGGGSPMDAAKGIALLAAQNISEENLFSGSYENKILPMAFVPTTSGTGSEVTKYSILTNDKAQTKTSIATELIFPTIAFLDAKYTDKLSVEVTINTAIDALSHAIEGMLSVKSSMITNALAEKSAQLIMGCVPEMIKAIESPTAPAFSPQTRENLLQASFLAGVVIAQTGTTAVHAMGYSLTYFKHIDHGKANGMLLAEYLRLVEKERPDLSTEILLAMNLDNVDEFKSLIKQLLGEEQISQEEIKQYSEMAIQTANIGNCMVKPTKENIAEMFEQSLRCL
ncbi:MAG: iron-containing alcohol dehydrogenase [Acetobacterium woodii]|nr:iron-containing alcohol dehydrogenase [Acetobacterium woodii]